MLLFEKGDIDKLMEEMTLINGQFKFLMSKNAIILNEPIIYLAYEINNPHPFHNRLEPINYKNLQNAFILDFVNPIRDYPSPNKLQPFHLEDAIPLSDQSLEYGAYKGFQRKFK